MKKQLIPMLAIVSLLLFGAGLFAASVVTDWAGDRAIELVPADASAYASFFIKPSVPQQRALEDLLAKFPGDKTVDHLRDGLERLLDPQAAKLGLDWAEDVEPWLGDQIAVFSIGTDDSERAILIQAKDEGAAVSAVEQAVAHDEGITEAYAFIDGFLVAGSRAAVGAARAAAEGSSLADDAAYVGTSRNLTVEGIGSAFLRDPALLADLGVEGGGLAFAKLLGFGRGGPAAAAIHVTPEGVVVESSNRQPVTLDAELLSSLLEPLLGDE